MQNPVNAVFAAYDAPGDAPLASRDAPGVSQAVSCVEVHEHKESIPLEVRAKTFNPGITFSQCLASISFLAAPCRENCQRAIVFSPLFFLYKRISILSAPVACNHV